MNARIPLVLEPDDINIDEWMDETETEHKVKPAAHWEDALNDEFRDQGDGDVHPRLPWPRLDHKFSLRPGEVTLWFGFSGHGKSLLLGQVLLSLAAQGIKSCTASLEMWPHKTLARMARQYIDASNPSPSQVREFVRSMTGKVWLYDQTGTVDVQRVYAVIRYAAARLGIHHFVVDNLTKCTQADDDYAGQKAIVDKLTALARDLGIHIHLVHHARKDRDETRPPRKMDALGASAITNLVDNVFIVWRNKGKYEKAEVDHTQPDAMLICDKQRHGTGWEGLQNLTYHQRSQQYVQSGSSAMCLSNYPHEAA